MTSKHVFCLIKIFKLLEKILELQSCIATLITSLNKDSAMGIFFYSLVLLLLLFILNLYMPNGISQYCQKTDPFLIQGLLDSNLQGR